MLSLHWSGDRNLADSALDCAGALSQLRQSQVDMLGEILRDPAKVAILRQLLGKFHMFSLELATRFTIDRGNLVFIKASAGNSRQLVSSDDISAAPGRIYDRATKALIVQPKHALGQRPRPWAGAPTDATRVDIGACFAIGSPVTLYRVLDILRIPLMLTKWRPGVPIERQIHDAAWSVEFTPPYFKHPRHTGSVYGVLHDMAARATALTLPKLEPGAKAGRTEWHLMADVYNAIGLSFASGRINPPPVSDSHRRAAGAPPSQPRRVRDIQGKTRPWSEVPHDTRTVLDEDNTLVAKGILEHINQMLSSLMYENVYWTALCAATIKLHGTSQGDWSADPDGRPLVPCQEGWALCQPGPDRPVQVPKDAPGNKRYSHYNGMTVVSTPLRPKPKPGQPPQPPEQLPLHVKPPGQVAPQLKPPVYPRPEPASIWIAWYQAMRNCQTSWSGWMADYEVLPTEAQAILMIKRSQQTRRNLLCAFEETRHAEPTIRAAQLLCDWEYCNINDVKTAITALNQWATARQCPGMSEMVVHPNGNTTLCSWVASQSRTATRPADPPAYDEQREFISQLHVDKRVTSVKY